MEMMEMDKKQMLEEAKKDFAAGMNWINFSNKYFGTGNPYIPKDETEREKFMDTPEFKEVFKMKKELEKSQPNIENPSEKEYNGKILLRVPASVHESLVLEADAEGVSLNQLLLAKVCIPLCDVIKPKK
jgi:methanogenic corrinoid protein MtbC1